MFSIDLLDFLGTQIQATFFGDAAEKFNPVVSENHVYLFSKGTVKPANQKFTSIKNDYCITFNCFAEITEVKDDGDIQEENYNFTTISQMQDILQETALDFIGIVKEVSPVTEIKLKKGDTKPK